MTLRTLLKNIGSIEKLYCRAQPLATSLNLVWGANIECLLNAAFENPELIPKITGSSLEEALKKWLAKYKKGIDKRISRRLSNPPGTVPDSVIDFIIGHRLPHLSEVDLVRIRFAHRLSMSAENILGLLLEEFLAIELTPFQWHCCWGEVLRSVDFVNADGRLLQIKNRSNSENSSSSRVRDDTDIDKWFRVNASNGAYLWHTLNELHNTTKFSESRFRKFIARTLEKNCNALAIEANNPWCTR